MVSKPPYRRNSENQPQYRPGGQRSSGRRGRSLIPLLIFAAAALFIASREIPWLKDMINAWVAPAEQQAIELCREAALQESPQPEFARIIRRGEATKTQNGYLVDQLTLGEMSTAEGEQLIRITCHVSQDGVIANLHRETIENAMAMPAQNEQRPSGPPGK